MATRATHPEILTAEQVGPLLLDPVLHMSVAAQVARIINTSSSAFRIPMVTADPSADWTAEGTEIEVSEAELDELTIVPSKLAGLTIITRELANDSTPEAAETVGNGLARDISRKVDEAWFGSNDGTAEGVQPAGLEDLTGVTEVSLDPQWVNADPFTSAIYAAEGNNARVAAWVTNPDDAMQLSQIKEGTGSNRDLLTADATQAGRRMIAGVPLLTSPYVTAGTVWGMPEAQSYLVVREDVEVLADRSVFFTSDRVAVRGIMRVGFGWPHPAAVTKITLSA